MALPRPAPTVRLRLTALYGVTFLVTGALLLTIGYLLVRHNLSTRPNFRVEMQRLGVPFFPGPPRGLPSRFGPGTAGARVAEAVRQQLRADALHRLLAEYGLALVAMTAVSVAAGWLLAGRALRPLRKITATARRVSGENLGERIGLIGPADELKELADTFDGMLSRLDAAFASQRHFVASASHELRTPLAIMRTEVDVALADKHASAGELRAMGETVRDTVDGCERLIESLLMLARSEAAMGHEEEVDLGQLAADCLTDLRAQAQEAGVEMTAQLQTARTCGEAALLERMIANLLENGIRHNHPGGYLSISTAHENASVRLTIRNGGPVIDAQDAAMLTEPFRRLGTGHGGFGLGLSIVSSVVRAHHGKLRLDALARGGLGVEITLPASPGQFPEDVAIVRRQPALT